MSASGRTRSSGSDSERPGADVDWYLSFAERGGQYSPVRPSTQGADPRRCRSWTRVTGVLTQIATAAPTVARWLVAAVAALFASAAGAEVRYIPLGKFAAGD